MFFVHDFVWVVDWIFALLMSISRVAIQFGMFYLSSINFDFLLLKFC